MPSKLAGDVTHIEQLGSLFAVEVPGIGTTVFTDVSGLSIEVGVIDHQVATTKGDTVTKKVMGTPSYGDITLKRSLSSNRDFYDWAQEVVRGEASKFRRDCGIVLYDAQQKELGRWEVQRAFPKKWSASDLDVGSDDVMVEEITLAIEGLRRVK